MNINLSEKQYGFNDIWIKPAVISNIEHRAECNPYIEDKILPLFTAPMNSVINEENYKIFQENGINTIIPRGVDYNIRYKLSTKTFIAVGLDEFIKFIDQYKEELYSCDDSDDLIRYVCVDIANGHMKKLIDLCAKAKSIFTYHLVIMTGNIANSLTYLEYAKAGIDYVRCQIGSGSMCITSCNVSIHTGIVTLLKEIIEQRNNVQADIEYCQESHFCSQYKSVPYVIADGGFNNFSKIIKALALGVDYVMIGQIFAQTEEACGEIKIDDGFRYREYYGMSTKRAQAETGKTELRTSEGIEKRVKVLYTLSGWCDNFKSYLQSAMSYTNSRNLIEFANSELCLVSNSEFKDFYK